jgi:hypothetical protein
MATDGLLLNDLADAIVTSDFVLPYCECAASARNRSRFVAQCFADPAVDILGSCLFRWGDVR